MAAVTQKCASARRAIHDSYQRDTCHAHQTQSEYGERLYV
jgi:hypothetical protein